MARQIHEVYEELGEILNKPKAFGLGSEIPKALAERLKSLREMLEEAVREQNDPPDDEREHYLVSDSNCFG